MRDRVDYERLVPTWLRLLREAGYQLDKLSPRDRQVVERGMRVRGIVLDADAQQWGE